jgi:pimeloyl-ACP methyl ester carboxylesterase
MLKWLIAVIVLYAGFVALLYVVQRSLQYFPERRRTAPRAIGLPEAEEAVLDTTDGERVIVWHVPPREGRPVFLYFHGNGGSLRWRDERFRALITDGSGLVALSYRGYGGSSGRPTESGLVEDAAAAYRARRGLGNICGVGAGREGLLRISRRADQLPAIAPLPPPRSYCRRRDRMGNIHGRNRNICWRGLLATKKNPKQSTRLGA